MAEQILGEILDNQLSDGCGRLATMRQINIRNATTVGILQDSAASDIQQVVHMPTSIRA